MLCTSDGFSPVLTAALSSYSSLQNFDVMTKTKRKTNMIQKFCWEEKMPPVPTAAFSSCRVAVQHHTGETLSEEIVTFFINTSYLIFVIFFYTGKNFWRIKFTPKNANFSR